MGTTRDKALHLVNVKDDLKAAFIEQGQNPTDVIATYPDIVRNMGSSEGLTEVLDEQTIVADELLELAQRKYFAARNAGVYVWKKLTAENGDFIEYVVSGKETTYPDGGEQDGYWYEMFDPMTLLAENIREGVDIWGVIGSMSEGVTGIDYGKITFSSATTEEVTISHNLGRTPKRAYLIAASTKYVASQSVLIAHLMNSTAMLETTTGYEYEAVITSVPYGSGSASIYDTAMTSATNSTVTFGRSIHKYKTYYWIVIV